jgi:hypothetical protein
MQFDAKASTPKVVFSPAAAVDASIMEVLQRQGKSAAAETAVKLTVYQNDEATTDTPVQAAPATPVSAEVSDVDASEPVLRTSSQPAPQPVNNASEVMKKWSVKS